MEVVEEVDLLAVVGVLVGVLVGVPPIVSLKALL